MTKKPIPIFGRPMTNNLTADDEAVMRQKLAEARFAAEETDDRRREAWPHNNDDGKINLPAAMAVLANSFPTLHGSPGAEPWDAITMLKQLCPGGGGYSEKLAARFVLGVWNSDEDWIETARKHGIANPEVAAKFDVFEAISKWDDEHRRAFLTWCEAPFWP